MSTSVVMPQMGESVAEGTIVRWLKQVGDAIERDEPLLEISTDKVDAEIPSPASGVIAEIRHKAGETVEINTVLAVILAAGEQIAAPPVAAPAPASPETPAHPATSASATPPGVAARPASVVPTAPETHGDARTRRLSTPVARNVARAHDLDLVRVTGTGAGGRIMKADVLALVEGQPAAAQPARHAAPASPHAPASTAPAHVSAMSSGAGLAGQTVPMSVMRKKIAEHMIASRQTSAHVHSVTEVDFTNVERVRQTRKAEFEQSGAKITYLSFILQAAAQALKSIPIVNASVDGDRVIYHRDVHVGIAVALDWGLIVPVIRNADRLNLLELSKAVVDLSGRARAKKLKPEDVSGGTFTITNPGVFGATFGMPIINQPQVAILGIGAVEKRVVSVNDALAIRRMAYLSLGFDHRVIDGAVADTFLAHIKDTLERA